VRPKSALSEFAIMQKSMQNFLHDTNERTVSQWVWPLGREIQKP
jgi:hypothetical protein